ncbi:MAG TPA: PhoU domain-containing protein [Acidimicrobiales bacterium]|nr:PhoU domain-containing protein [Acidimicrobiales bacterium]
MTDTAQPLSLVDQRIAQLFALVREALAGATESLLDLEPETGQAIVDADRVIDELTSEVDDIIWQRIEAGSTSTDELRYFVSVLLILPELERSADLAEHIAQRAIHSLGAEMTPVSRGLVQRMSEVALEMWSGAADAYVDRTARAAALDQTDEELDILHERLTHEIGTSGMSNPVTTEVTLVARFYERLGDHAVNLARRIATLPEVRADRDSSPGN